MPLFYVRNIVYKMLMPKFVASFSKKIISNSHKVTQQQKKTNKTINIPIETIDKLTFII